GRRVRTRRGPGPRPRDMPAAVTLRRDAAFGSPAEPSADLPLPLGLCNHEWGKAHQVAARQPRADEDPLRLVAPLLHRRAERVQLREPRSLVVGHQEAYFLETLREVRGNPRAQLVEAFAGQR